MFFRPGDTVSELIQRAYDVLAFQVVGGPDWIRKDRFQINARSSSEVSIEQMNVMLQSLLEDRFSLAVRRGEQNMRFQALTLARSDGRLGAGLRRCAEPDNAPPAKPVRIPRGGWASSRVCSPISTVAAIGTDLLGTPIIDRTGLAGLWTYELAYATGPVTDLSPAEVPPFSTAIQEQLGLKLQDTRGLVGVLVVEAVQQPTEN